MTTDTEPELQQNLRALQSQLETTKKELAESQKKLVESQEKLVESQKVLVESQKVLADSQKKLAESQEKVQRFQTNVAPWWPRFLFAILVSGTIVGLTANRLLSIEVKSWLDLTSIGLILFAWCATSGAAFWYTRTLR